MGYFWPLQMISLLANSSFICSSGHAVQWDKEKYRRKLVLYEEIWFLFESSGNE